MTNHSTDVVGFITLIGDANVYVEKIVDRFRKEKGVTSSKPHVINKILSDYIDMMPKGELSKNMTFLRLQFCLLSFTERDYAEHGKQVRVTLKDNHKEIIREIKEFNKKTSRIVSNIREIPNAIIHDFIGIARVNGEAFDDFYFKLKTNG